MNKRSKKRSDKRREKTYNYWKTLISDPNKAVCGRWATCFNFFMEDMGFIPNYYTYIELKRGEKLYNKQNCNWYKPVNYREIPVDIYKAVIEFSDPNYLPDRKF